jgi:hypothetical protein
MSQAMTGSGGLLMIGGSVREPGLAVLPGQADSVLSPLPTTGRGSYPATARDQLHVYGIGTADGAAIIG